MKSLSAKFLLILCLSAFIISCVQKSGENADETLAVDSTQEYVGEEVTYSTDSTTMKGYLAYDKNSTDKKPGILVVHEWWGHNEYTRERADMLAKLGYVALAVDMYGDGKVAQHPQDAQKFMMSVFSNIEEAEARFDKALELLKSNEKVDGQQIGVIGYCFGGSVALTMANMGKDLDAVAAFHSGVQLPVMPTSDIKAKILVCNGGADPFVSEESVENFKSAMDSVNASYKYIAYDSAKHAFTSKGATAMGEKFELPLEYNAEADEASWEEMKALFSDVFTK
ncbi:MAG: dienelactone hydrolase family protein [Fulvivirga sp.]|uniref:dienelactone hydrolase family protein n=1 Tax=Fulvivirga sp. TaxID=1931237 RepID=UPI0032EAD903